MEKKETIKKEFGKEIISIIKKEIDRLGKRESNDYNLGREMGLYWIKGVIEDLTSDEFIDWNN